MQYVYDGLAKGWFLNVDGDELVYLKGRALKQEVSDQPDQVRSVMIRPAERFYCPEAPDEMHFRTIMPPWCCRAVYGEMGAAMQKRKVLSGHWFGKSLTRTGLAQHRVRQHFLQTPEHEALSDVVLDARPGAYLLHFVDQ
jgi:hypothetical protein